METSPYHQPLLTKRCIFRSTDNNIYAVDTAIGTEQWRFETDGSILASPAVSTNTVYAGGKDDILYALDRTSGDKRWEFDTGGEIHAAPVATADTVDVVNNANGASTSLLRALRTTDGSERWRLNSAHPAYTSIAVADAPSTSPQTQLPSSP
jgi:outer membrane protein assembly factor BamB